MEDKIRILFDELHSHPEPSGQETMTSRIIRDFMNENTSMTFREVPGGFFYEYRVNDDAGIVFRADYDAVTIEEGRARHLCGHDGHSASLCQLALMIERNRPDRNIKLLFQSSEENGQGARNCLEALKKDDIIYGQHNLPGFEFGKVYTSLDTFACTSCGLIIDLKGQSSHAAYPELGLSPAGLVSDILKLAEKYKRPEKMATVIEVKMGEETFGVMAHEARICLTLRSTTDEGLASLKQEILGYIEGHRGELESSHEIIDYFPATVNHPEQAQLIIDRLNGELLTEPMRWSEDFAWYMQDHNGAFFGIGAGTEHPGLHTSDYCYPVELIDITAGIFYNLIV